MHTCLAEVVTYFKQNDYKEISIFVDVKDVLKSYQSSVKCTEKENECSPVKRKKKKK